MPVANVHACKISDVATEEVLVGKVEPATMAESWLRNCLARVCLGLSSHRFALPLRAMSIVGNSDDVRRIFLRAKRKTDFRLE